MSLRGKTILEEGDDGEGEEERGSATFVKDVKPQEEHQQQYRPEQKSIEGGGREAPSEREENEEKKVTAHPGPGGLQAAKFGADGDDNRTEQLQQDKQTSLQQLEGDERQQLGGDKKKANILSPGKESISVTSEAGDQDGHQTLSRPNPKEEERKEEVNIPLARPGNVLFD